MTIDMEKILIEGNLKFKRKILEDLESIEVERKVPRYPVLILTCMDPRIDVHRIFQLKPGDVFVLRNAGN
ncbi:MAG: carbonic anhydrase, partial [Candidatus Heimdallarchaeota archaeon]